MNKEVDIADLIAGELLCSRADAYDLMRNALSKVQQPVAWVDVKDKYEGPYEFHGMELLPVGKHNLYTTPQPPEQPQPRSDYAVHMSHCNMGEHEGVCKYGDDDCPALEVFKHKGD